MLERLQFSSNPITASVCSRILEGYESIKEAKQRGYGGFMQAVLEGRHDDALCLADADNLRCISDEHEDFFPVYVD